MSTTTQGIKTVLHQVTDVERAKPVYTALLGVEPTADAPYYVGYEAEGQQIGLVPGGGGGMTSPVAYWHVADIDAKLADRGWHVARRPARRRWRAPRGDVLRPRWQRPRADSGPLTAMDVTIHGTFLPHTDPEVSLAFYRDTLGFEVRNDVGYGGMRWITVGPPAQPGMSIVLHPPAVDPGITTEERRTITEMMAKGSYATILFATADLDGAFEEVQTSGAEIVQEPMEQPYGIRDCAIRDPAGNLIRISEVR